MLDKAEAGTKVQRLQLLLKAGKEGRGDHLDWVVGQAEVEEGGRGGEGSVVDLVDVVVRQVQGDQLLDLVEQRVRDQRDVVVAEVQVAQTALHRVQRLDGDFLQGVERHLEDLHPGLLQQGLEQVGQLVVAEINNLELVLTMQTASLGLQYLWQHLHFFTH